MFCTIHRISKSMFLRFIKGSNHITGSLILTSLSQLTDVTFAEEGTISSAE